MKKIIYCLCLLSLPCFLTAQVRLINNGVIIKVNNAVNLRSNGGSISNQNSGSINNDGNVYMDLDYTQTTGATYTGGTASWLWFEGAANQTITGDATLNVARLRVDNANRLVLGNDVNVSTDVDLRNNGNIELGAFNLVMAPGGTIANYDASSYIITNSTGVLQQEVGGTNVIYPVGNSTYNPATLNNSGTTDNFTIRVTDQVLDAGTAGSVLTTDVVDRTWLIDETVLGGSNITMTLEWEQGDELTAFDRTTSGIAHHLSGTIWDNPPAYTTATNVGGTTWSQTRSGFTSFSPFIVRDFEVDLPVEMLYFNAAKENAHQVQLDWATASEINNQGFEVERMLDNETSFSKIAWVDGNGTTVNTSYYELLDDNSYSGVSYYRLKQVDFDGTFAYSEIRAVEGEYRNTEIAVFPNPVDDYIHIQIKEAIQKATIQIFDSKGALIRVFRVDVQPGELIRLEGLSALVDGIYLINIQTDTGSNYTQKLEKIEN